MLQHSGGADQEYLALVGLWAVASHLPLLLVTCCGALPATLAQTGSVVLLAHRSGFHSARRNARGVESALPHTRRASRRRHARAIGVFNAIDVLIQCETR
jgi:hypothetical protein